jgi:hypothetical protein
MSNAQELKAASAPKRWVQFNAGDVRLVAWDAVSSVTFDKQENGARLTGADDAAGVITDTDMLERLRRAVAAEPTRWVRSRTRKSGTWVKPEVAETYVDIQQVRRISIVQPIDVGGIESYALVGPNVGDALGLVVDDAEKARVKALWTKDWPSP